MAEHFVLAGRLIGTDEGWVDCVCGWHHYGTVVESREEGERHMRMAEQSAQSNAEIDALEAALASEKE